MSSIKSVLVNFSKLFEGDPPTVFDEFLTLTDQEQFRIILLGSSLSTVRPDLFAEVIKFKNKADNINDSPVLDC